MTLKMPMDQDLYDAAVKVMDKIEERLLASERRLSDEDVLGAAVADAYRSWRTLLVGRYASHRAADTVEPDVKIDGRRNNRPVRPSKGHPWRSTAKR